MSSTINDSEDIAYQLLADWWMGTIQSLVDSAGSQKAMDHLRPYCRNAAMAGAFMLKDSLGLNTNDRTTWGYVAKTGVDILTRGDHFECIIKEKGSVARVKECPFRHAPVELCMMVCDLTSKIQGEIFAPDFDVKLVSTLSQGDSECLWVIKPKSWTMPKDFAKLGSTIMTIENKPIPKELVDDISIQYLAEYWVISIRAHIDYVGIDRSIDLMRPYMKHSGVSFGLRFQNSRPDGAKNIEKIATSVEYCSRMLHMEGGRIESEGDLSGKTITDCPFKDAPATVCKQFETFCNGICEAIDPDYEFIYDRMMTKGERNCHWMIRKKCPTAKFDGGERSGSMDETAVELLKKRLVRGEITPDQYRKLKDILSENK